MRLWSIHPKYLDPAGLVALWREGLLAQAVLAGRTRGYTKHPQLERFREDSASLSLIRTYLREVWTEADRRGYSFDLSKIEPAFTSRTVPVTRDQLRFEWQHLSSKLTRRDPEWLAQLGTVRLPKPNPVFVVVKGSIESWERS